MTTKEFIALQRKRLSKIIKENVPLQRAVIITHTQQTKRIFELGKNSANSKIGNYNSTNPLYVNPKNSPKAVPLKGKTGKSTFNNGKKHVTGYFSSYKAFRNQQGRQTSFVDLVLSGRLRSEYSRPPVKINPSRFIVKLTGENADKARGAESKYGKIFSLTKQEKVLFLKTNKKEFIKALGGNN